MEVKGLVSMDKFGSGSQAYFLSHLHLDQTRDLVGGWSHGRLYCSKITANLLRFRQGIGNIHIDLSLIHELNDEGESTILNLADPKTGSAVTISVTAIPALHCPGSFMYLLRGGRDIGCILYTGHFRWEKDSNEAMKAKELLRRAIGKDTVKVLYLDNTYCHPSIYFPPRPVVARQVAEFIKAHPNHIICIGVGNLGKEELFMEVARRLDTKIVVATPDRLGTIHNAGIDNERKIFTIQNGNEDSSIFKVRAVQRSGFTLSQDNIEDIKKLSGTSTISILLSGRPSIWKIIHGVKQSMHYDPKSPPCFQGAYIFPYTGHACYSELEEFIKEIRPLSVIGMVSQAHLDPCHHFQLVAPSRRL